MAKMKRDEFNIWKCLACEGQPEFEHQQFIEHLEQVHGVLKDAKGIKGERDMRMHLDSQEYFESTYEWTINDLKFMQYVRCQRASDDMMRYM